MYEACPFLSRRITAAERRQIIAHGVRRGFKGCDKHIPSPIGATDRSALADGGSPSRVTLCRPSAAVEFGALALLPTADAVGYSLSALRAYSHSRISNHQSQITNH